MTYPKSSNKKSKKPAKPRDKNKEKFNSFTPVGETAFRLVGGTDSATTFGANDTTEAWAGTTIVSTGVTPRGTRFSLNKSKKDFDIKYIFKIVKKKLTVLENKKLVTRMKNLEKLINERIKLGQFKLAEENMTYLERITRESEIYACGFTLFLEREHLEKFRDLAKDKDNLFLTKLEDYMREIPLPTQKKLKKAQENKLFDEYHILHYDPALKAIPEEEKKKIIKKRKDPILFGVFKQSSRFYFIGDWIDEYCDLTLEDIIDAVKIDEDGIVLDSKIDENDFDGKPREVIPARTIKKKTRIEK